MKQQKLTEYRPNYPRKALRGAALTAAALAAIGGMTGCVRVKVPGVELQTDGMVAITTEPPEEVLVTEGEVAIPEPTEEELVLDGEVAIWEPEETPQPTAEPMTTTGMLLMPTDAPQH